MKKIVTKLMLGLLATGLMFTAWSGAVWAEEPDGRGHLRGTVVSIEGQTLFITTPRGDEKEVLTDDDTGFRVPGVEVATLADIAVGDYVVVRARPTEEGTFLAAWVGVIPGGQEGDVAMSGLVTAVEDTTLTVRTGRGEISVLTDEQTRFVVPDVENPTIADVQVGRPVRVLGQREGDESFRASAVFVVPGAVVRRHIVHGKVTAVDGEALTVDTPKGEQRVLTDENTNFFMPGLEDPGLADITPGTWIAAMGHRNEDGSLQARSILAISEQWLRRALRGQVLAIDGDALTIETRRGELQLMTDENTRYRALLDPEPLSLADIEVGNKVIVFGRRTEDGSVLALAVVVLPR